MHGLVLPRTRGFASLQSWASSFFFFSVFFFFLKETLFTPGAGYCILSSSVLHWVQSTTIRQLARLLTDALQVLFPGKDEHAADPAEGATKDGRDGRRRTVLQGERGPTTDGGVGGRDTGSRKHCGNNSMTVDGRTICERLQKACHTPPPFAWLTNAIDGTRVCTRKGA